MMGRLKGDQGQLFYEFHLSDAVPEDHLVRKIDAALDLSWLRGELAPHCSSMGRPSIDPELMIQMLVVGYVFAIRSERLICREVQVNLAYRWFCKLGIRDADDRLRVPTISSEGGHGAKCAFAHPTTSRRRKLFPRPDRLALLTKSLEAFPGVLGHRQKRDLAFGVGDALVERHRGNRAHRVFAAPDRSRRFVDDASDQPLDLAVQFGCRHDVVEKARGLRRPGVERLAGQRPFVDQPRRRD
jgi:transposase-like protein DUF772